MGVGSTGKIHCMHNRPRRTSGAGEVPVRVGRLPTALSVHPVYTVNRGLLNPSSKVRRGGHSRTLLWEDKKWSFYLQHWRRYRTRTKFPVYSITLISHKIIPSLFHHTRSPFILRLTYVPIYYFSVREGGSQGT